MKERTSYVYELRCIVNDKGYVGQTVRKPEVRWTEHIEAAFKPNRRPLHRAIKKYGVESFTAEVLWQGPESKLNAAEKHFVRQRKTFIDTGWGYNCTTGGDTYRVSKTARRKMSRHARQIMLDRPDLRVKLIGFMHANPETSKRALDALRFTAATPECRSKHSKATKHQWAAKRDKMCEAIGIACQKPSYRRKRSKIQKRRWVGRHEEFCVSLKIGHNTPTAKANHAAANKRRWAAGNVYGPPWNKGMRGGRVPQ
jgi:group I intron endonuclease